MIGYLEKKFALSHQGAKDLLKGIWSCTLTDIGLMLPMGILYVLLEDLLVPLMGGEAVHPNFWLYTASCIALLGILYILYYNQYNHTFLSSYVESANKRITLAEKLRKLPLSYFGKKDLSDLTTTIMSDCAGLETAFSHFIPQLSGSILSVILVGTGLFFMDYRMAIALLWVVPAAFIITAGSKAIQDKVNRNEKAIQLEYVDSIQECIETVRDIKANNQSESYLGKLDKKLQHFERTAIKSEFLVAIFVTSSQMILKVGIATVILAGGQLLIKGETDVLTFLMFLIAASRMFDPLSASMINLAALFNSLLKIERMNEMEDQPIQKGSERASYKGYDITFDHVGFAYNDGETVLKDVSFVAKQGEVTALVGPSGGGKSTAAKLAARFWDVTKGQILLGGTNISGVEPEALLSNFAIVFQDVVLFNDTIMNNIRIGRRNATDEEVMEAARAAQCEDFILKMPEGYESVVGENGSTLSGGERQRLSIARALLKDAPVVLLDEATASLDVENETKIQEALSNLVRNKTVLVIAHRMRTVAGADKVVVLSNGYVAEQGTPESLFEKDGVYAKMVSLQQESSNWQVKEA